MILSFILAFIVLILVGLGILVLWAVFSTTSRKPKLEEKVPRSRRKLTMIEDEQDGAIYQVTKSRRLGEFKRLLTFKGGGGLTVQKIVWAWQLVPANSLAAVTGKGPAIWKLTYDPKLTYQQAEKKAQEVFDENQKLRARVATFEAEEGERAREIIDETAKLLSKAKDKEREK